MVVSDLFQMTVVTLMAAGALGVLVRANWPRRQRAGRAQPGCPSCASCDRPTT
jgi:hypothetical protein